MPRVLSLVAWPALVGALLFPLSAQAYKPGPTQGFRECTEMCYIRECGEVGYKCPTVTQKKIYRRLCFGRCKEVVRRQEFERRLAPLRLKMQMERERAQRAKEMLLLKHKLWMEREQAKKKVRENYEKARMARDASRRRAAFRRMQLAHEQSVLALREKFRMKERFFHSRQKTRSVEAETAAKQVQFLKSELDRARKERDEARATALLQEMKQKKQLHVAMKKKAAMMKVQLFQAKVQQKDQEQREIEQERQTTQAERKEAGKENDRDRLRALARRLGALAGQKAALAQKKDADQRELEKARSMLASISQEQAGQ
ncbi:MAG: hypothetical protein H6727_02350 [Myxococcales bacterium]|nr:hypothetical protein [Myxococcales bacterium]